MGKLIKERNYSGVGGGLFSSSNSFLLICCVLTQNVPTYHLQLQLQYSNQIKLTFLPTSKIICVIKLIQGGKYSRKETIQGG